MKKILVVLTILVLVAGFAFAGISGKVTAKYGILFYQADKDGNAAFGYAGDNKSLAASVTLDKQIGGKTGEVAPYVDLKITAEFTRVYENSETYGNGKNRPADKFKLSIDTFAIVGEDWKVNLLKAEDAKLDLAKSAIDSITFHKDAKDENTQSFSMAKDIAYTKGISVTYKDFVVGLGFNTNDLRDQNAAITVEAKTPEFVFGDVKVQAGVGFSQTGYTKTDATKDSYVFVDYYEEYDDLYVPRYELVPGKDAKEDFGGVKVFVGSAKIAYEAEAVKASVAADFSKSSKENEAKFDLAANIQVAPVTVDVFYGNYVQVKNGKEPKNVVLAENLLSAKAVVDVAKIAENLPVKLTITGKDLLNRKDNVKAGYYIMALGKAAGKIVDIEVNTTALANFDITATAGDIFNKPATFAELDVVYTGIANIKLEGDVSYTFASKLLDVDLSATYTAEKYTAKAEVGVATDFEDTVFDFGASIESDKLVDGATLKAELAGLSFGYQIKDSKKVATLGSLSLSCTVEF